MVDPPAPVARCHPARHPAAPRDLEVLRLITNGFSARSPQPLVISPETVKTFVSRILAELGLRDRVQAVAYAYRQGLVT
ncbi:LuxR C-terminal-related transcriptional regulator [Streptomyces sp. NPDC002911]